MYQPQETSHLNQAGFTTGLQMQPMQQRERYSLNAQVANQRQALANIIMHLDGIEAALFGAGPQTPVIEPNAKNVQPESVEQIVGGMASQIDHIQGIISRISDRL